MFNHLQRPIPQHPGLFEGLYVVLTSSTAFCTTSQWAQEANNPFEPPELI